MHPNGQIPAYEWAFGDVNPPVHAWAALRVFEIDGGRDYAFLARVLHKLLLNFTWWVNRKDAGGNNVFEGGFLGLDNVGPFDRSAALPVGRRAGAGRRHRLDGACTRSNLLDIALDAGRARHGPTRTSPPSSSSTSRYIADGRVRAGAVGRGGRLLLRRAAPQPTGTKVPLKVRSVVGLLPLAASDRRSPPGRCSQLPELARPAALVPHQPPGVRRRGRHPPLGRTAGSSGCCPWSAPDQLVRHAGAGCSTRRSSCRPYGLRTLSPARTWPSRSPSPSAGSDFTVGYEPAESQTGLFGGNSNWRGPIWFPLNLLLIEALRRYADVLRRRPPGRVPDRLGSTASPRGRAEDLATRLISALHAGRHGEPTRRWRASRPVDGARVARPGHVLRVLRR